MKYFVWLVYNLAILATALYLTIYFQNGWWMGLAFFLTVQLEEKEVADET